MADGHADKTTAAVPADPGDQPTMLPAPAGFGETTPSADVSDPGRLAPAFPPENDLLSERSDRRQSDGRARPAAIGGLHLTGPSLDLRPDSGLPFAPGLPLPGLPLRAALGMGAGGSGASGGNPLAVELAAAPSLLDPNFLGRLLATSQRALSRTLAPSVPPG